MRPAISAFMPRAQLLWGGAGGQYLGHHRFCHISKTSSPAPDLNYFMKQVS